MENLLQTSVNIEHALKRKIIPSGCVPCIYVNTKTHHLHQFALQALGFPSVLRDSSILIWCWRLCMVIGWWLCAGGVNFLCPSWLPLSLAPVLQPGSGNELWDCSDGSVWHYIQMAPSKSWSVWIWSPQPPAVVAPASDLQNYQHNSPVTTYSYCNSDARNKELYSSTNTTDKQKQKFIAL